MADLIPPPARGASAPLPSPAASAAETTAPAAPAEAASAATGAASSASGASGVGPAPAEAPKAGVPAGPLPKSPATFDSNDAFADLDATMGKAVAALAARIKLPPLNGQLTDAQIKEISTGKLAGASLAANLADVQNVVKLLATPQGQAYKAQLGSPITAQALDAALKTGFAGAHEVMLKGRLTAYAAALDGPLKPFLDAKTKALNQGQLQTLLSSGVIGGKKITDLIPDAKARQAFLDGVAVLTDNRRLFAAIGTMNCQQLADVVMGKPVAVKDDTYNWTVTMADVVNATLPVKPAPEAKVDVLDPRWKAKFPVLFKEYDAYIDSQKMVPFHEAWHSNNGSGGTKGPGSGEWFLQFHAQMGGGFIEWLKMRGKTDAALVDGTLPKWGDMTKPLPDEFFKNPNNEPTNIDWTPPSFLQRRGATPDVQAFRLDRKKVIKSLDDIQTMDDLGRVLGESGGHAVAHVQFGDVMATFKSVADHKFIPWHYGSIEGFRQEWLKTENGKKWLAANPLGWSRPFLDAHDEVMHDVVDRILKPAADSFTAAGAVGGAGGPGGGRGPIMASRGPIKPPTAQDVRAARQTAEALCLTRSQPNRTQFTEDDLLEAAAGLKDPSKRKAAAERTAKRRAAEASTGAAPPKAWGG